MLRARHRRRFEDGRDINPLIHATIEVVVVDVVTPFPGFFILSPFDHITKSVSSVPRPFDHDDGATLEWMIVFMFVRIIVVRMLAVVGLAGLLLLRLFPFLLLGQRNVPPYRVLSFRAGRMLSFLVHVPHRHEFPSTGVS